MNYEDLQSNDCCLALHGLRFIVDVNELKDGGGLHVRFEDAKPWTFGQPFIGSRVDYLGRGVLYENDRIAWPDGSTSSLVPK